MAFSGEHRDLRPLAFQQRVGGDRRAMDDAIRASQQFEQS
jgi:hypothetical protein